MTPFARSASFGIVLAAGAGVAQPAAAENPKLTLRVQNATAVEAAAQLTQAAGVPVEVQVPRLPAGAQPPASYRLLQEKTSFDWNGKTFAAALRDLSGKYQLRLSRRWGGFILFPGGAAPSAPEQKVGVTEQQGVKLSVRRVTVRNNRTLDFAGGPVAQDEQALTLELYAHLGEGDGDRIAGLENVVAMDDRGNLLVGERLGGRASGAALSGSLYPDEWAGAVNLSGAHPRAARLVWIEGDVIAYGSARMQPVDAPLPLPKEGFKKSVGETTAEVLQFEAGSGSSGPASTGPLVTIRVQSALGTGQETLPVPLLVGASGTLYSPATTTQTARRVGAGMAYEITGRFAAVAETVKAVRMNVVDRKEPHRLFNFRMQDVPLPAEAAFVPRRPVMAINPTNPAAARAFYQQGGGALVTSVKINDQPPPEGMLALGLAPKSGPEAGSVRWIDAPIGKDGTVRVPDLKPGKYRLLRTFQPRQDLRLAGVGRWQNNEVEVIVEAGQEAEVAPLSWKVTPTVEATEPMTGGTAKPAVTDKPKTTPKPKPKKTPTRRKPVAKKK